MERRSFSLARNYAACVAGITLALVFAIATAASLQAQTYTILHNFTTGPDGAYPLAVVVDRAGNLYGDATAGGSYGYFCQEAGCGTIFKLSQKNGSWLLSTLYTFDGHPHGAGPGMLAMANDGTLFATAYDSDDATARIIRLQPPMQPCRAVQCYWTYSTIYEFTNTQSGTTPNHGPVAFDPAGNIYGVTEFGGNPGCNFGDDTCGTVYELTKSDSTYDLSPLYLFSGPDGANPGPYEGLLLDPAGNIYGTTINGGTTRNYGTVFQLQNSGLGWTLNQLYEFSHDNDDQGRNPYAGLIMDTSGNLFGTTTIGGTNLGGTAFEMSYSGGWNLSVTYPFIGGNEGFGSVGALTLGPDGSLYGATYADGIYNLGAIFKLTYQNGSWNYQSLHDFRGGQNDGESPTGNLVFDAQGNLYGTTIAGGTYDGGTVWEITP